MKNEIPKNKDISSRWLESAGMTFISVMTKFSNTEYFKLHTKGAVIIKGDREYARIPISDTINTVTVSIKGTYWIEPIGPTWIEASPNFDNLTTSLACGVRNRKALVIVDSYPVWQDVTQHYTHYYEHHGLIGINQYNDHFNTNYSDTMAVGTREINPILIEDLTFYKSDEHRWGLLMRFFVESSTIQPFSFVIIGEVNNSFSTALFSGSWSTNVWNELIITYPARQELKVNRVDLANVNIWWSAMANLEVPAIISGTATHIKVGYSSNPTDD